MPVSHPVMCFFFTPYPTTHGVVFLCACVLAKYVVCQPWSRFLLYCLLGSGESCLLHPATLRVITLVRGFACANMHMTQVK